MVTARLTNVATPSTHPQRTHTAPTGNCPTHLLRSQLISYRTQQIFLETALPAQSQLLVSEVEAQKDSEDDSPVVLAGKMTLSVISLDSGKYRQA